MSFSLSKFFSSVKEQVPVTSRSVVGIDIGTSSVKVVEIEETEKALMLRTYGELQLGPYGGHDLGDIVELKKEKQIEVIVDVMREARVSAKGGVLAMPLSKSFVTVIPITLADDDDIDSKIYIEARKYIPIPLSDVTLDWSELPAIGKAETTVHDILIAAVENEALRTYKELLNAIDMVSQPSEIESFSLIRSLVHHNDKTVAIIDLGARTAKLYIIRNGVLERTHSVAAGGALITKRIAKLCGVSFEEAENMKRAYTPDMKCARDVQKATASVLDGPLTEFKRLMNRYEIRLGEPIGRITLSGGVSVFPNMKGYVSNIFTREEVEIGNPFAKLAYAAFMEDTLKQIAPTFGVSLGAALRQFDYSN